MFELPITTPKGKIMVYHVQYFDQGKAILKNPEIPDDLMADEDEEIPRICITTSIPEAINACADVIFKDPNFKYFEHDGFRTLYLYCAEVKTDALVQPTKWGVPDVWKSGELWLMQPTHFDKCLEYDIQRQCHFEGTPYSRFLFTARGEDPMVDRYIVEPIYGSIESFSMIMTDILYMDLSDRDNVKNVKF